MPVGDPLQQPKADAFLIDLVRAAFGPGLPERRGLAVSGGSDSMAMLHLFAAAGVPVEVATVDHRLRPEAAREAAFVAEACKKLGVPHRTLVWDHDAISGNLMQAASTARYRLLAAWARDRGLGAVALAHTADDQAETFLMGLSRAAGLDGLTGMRPEFLHDNVTFVRPLLRAGRDDLRAYLQRRALVWVDDPTNDDDRFARTRARRALHQLEPLGVSVDRLATVIRNLAAARTALAEAASRAGTALVQERAGALTFQRAAFLELGPELNRLMLQAMLAWMAGLTHAPRADKLRTLGLAIATGQDATLAGCRLRHRDGTYVMAREPRAVGGAVSPDGLWDGRWRGAGPAPAGASLRALGADGLRLLPDWRAVGLSRDVLMVTPALWQGDTLLAAPLATASGDWVATLEPPTRLFGLSH